MHPDLFYELAKKYGKPVEDVEFKILEAMKTYGGSFVVCLSQLYRLADPINERKLASTFEDYFRAYGDKVFLIGMGLKKTKADFLADMEKMGYKLAGEFDNEYGENYVICYSITTNRLLKELKSKHGVVFIIAGDETDWEPYEYYPKLTLMAKTFYLNGKEIEKITEKIKEFVNTDKKEVAK